VFDVVITLFPATSTASHTLPIHKTNLSNALQRRWILSFRISDILNPSNDASTTSPGRRLKIFFPAFEFASELVKYPETFTTPVRTPFATLSVISVILLTLYKNQLFISMFMFKQSSTPIERLIKNTVVTFGSASWFRD